MLAGNDGIAPAPIRWDGQLLGVPEPQKTMAGKTLPCPDPCGARDVSRGAGTEKFLCRFLLSRLACVPFPAAATLLSGNAVSFWPLTLQTGRALKLNKQT